MCIPTHPAFNVCPVWKCLWGPEAISRVPTKGVVLSSPTWMLEADPSTHMALHNCSIGFKPQSHWIQMTFVDTANTGYTQSTCRQTCKIKITVNQFEASLDSTASFRHLGYSMRSLSQNNSNTNKQTTKTGKTFMQTTKRQKWYVNDDHT